MASLLLVYTISDNAFFSLICLQYGLPTLLFLALNLICLNQFHYRMWRLQIWLHRLTERFRNGRHEGSIGGLAVKSDGFDTQNHYHDLTQDFPLIRLGVAPVLAFGVVMLMLVPFMLLLAWGFMMWLAVDKLLVGIAIVLMGICLVSLYYAIQYWHSGGWRMTSHIQWLFTFSLGCYFLLAFVLSFKADGVSFFGQSVHFLTLNYILLTELISQREKHKQIPAQTLLKADEYISGSSASGPVGLGAGGERLSKEEKERLQRDAEKKFFEKFKAEHALLPPTSDDATVTAGSGEQFEKPDSDEELPDDSDEAEAKRLAAESSGATLINIQAAKIEMKFKDVLHTLIHETQEAQSNEDFKYQVRIYCLSLAVLLGYSFAIYKGNGPSNPADDNLNGSAQYLGFVVSGILVIWDALMYIYATNNGKVLDEKTKILVLAGSRVALISFGFQGWFLGVVCLYAAAGIYLSYRIIDRRLPYSAFQLAFGAKQCQRFREFVTKLTNPDDELTTGSDNALLRTMSSGSGGIGIAEFVLIILSVLYFMALCISYQTGPPQQDGLEQWQIGIIVWYGVFLWLLSVWTIRYWMTSNWKISWQSSVLTIVTQGFFTLGGALVFKYSGSVIIIVWMVCGPLFVLSCLGTYMQCVKVDWHILSPSYMRNPPNLPFPLALLTCGLQKDDYRMMFNIVLSVTMMCVIGLGITLGLHGSPIGWSITFVLFILITSIIPLVKYLKTLSLDTMDGVLLSLWFIAHISFFSLLYYVSDGLTDRESFVFWGSCVGYPTILANILSYHLFKENGNRLNKNTAMVFLFTLILILICVIICFFTLGTNVGAMILGAMIVAVIMTALGIRWVNGNYTLPRHLRYVSIFAFAVLMVVGVIFGVLITDEGEGFWLFSASWFLLIIYVTIIAYGDKARLIGGDSSAIEATFRYSNYVFPVYYYDRRNEHNPVRPANLHMALYCLAFGLGFIWCSACMVTTRVNIGLGISALLLVGLYTFMRNRSISANKNLMKIIPYITEDTVKKAKEIAREMQLSGVSMLFDDPQPNIFGIKRWGQIIHGMLLINLNPLPQLKKKQQALKRKLGLGRSCFCARLETDPHELDDHLILLEQLNDWSFSVAKIQFKIEAHFYFLLLLNAMAEIQTEESAMKSFCQWLSKEKISPITGQPIELDPYISNYDIYDDPKKKFSQAYLLQLQQWKAEYILSLKAAATENEVNRQKELAAEAVRQERLEKKEKAIAERAKQREIAAAQVKDANGNALVLPPTVPTNVDPVVAEFQRAILTYKQTGKKYEDEDFPANAESLYLDGERNPAKGSALNATPIEDEWKRPQEILTTLQQENPEQVIPRVPKLFIDGFDLTDIVQGNIGTCYFLSAIGCLGIRELANPRQPLLTDIFTMESPTVEYNECGAFLVRFYRSGKKVNLLIDDRLPVSQGNFAFSHAKQLNEMWVSLLEKAYAKLFTCYEAIEAGLISQALCDLSNGASEQIAIKGPNGQVSVNPDDLWIKLEDSFKSGYLVGAGSNTGSDTTEVEGIAQGHAYMVVRVFTDAAQTERLIQLQNPHGHGEWTGDWSDGSDKWTQWWRNTLQNEKEIDDGKFWMSFQDFLQSYQNVYICRLLPYRKSLSSSWHGHTAAGPTEPYHNPTFCVSTPSPCKIWIELEQTNRRGKKPKNNGAALSEAELAEQQEQSKPATNDYAFIQFFMVENGGKRVEKIVKEQVKGCANKFKMLNDRQISAEVFLDAPDTPFTIVCVNKVKGFETGLTLSIFCADDAVKFWMLPEEEPPK